MKMNFAAIAISRKAKSAIECSSAQWPSVINGVFAWGIFALTFAATSAFAAVGPNLGAAFNYAVLGTNPSPTSGTVNCTDTGPGIAINGNVGTSANSITNNGCSINGTITAPIPAQVRSDLLGAYAALDTDNACDFLSIPTSSAVLPPGVYCSAAGTTIGTGVTFTLDGTANDVWVFKVGTGGGGALTTTGLQMVMGGTARACNVYWRTAEAASVTDSTIKGTVITGTAFTMTRGSFEGRALALTDATVTDAASLNFAGCAAPTQIVVNKTFSDGNPASVPVSLSCNPVTTVSSNPLNASATSPAVFSLSNPTAGTTCTATETVPAGYTADQSNCVDVPIGGSCTIVNTRNLNPGDATITVNKDFSPNSNAFVSVSLACTNGAAPLLSTLNAAEGAPAVFVLNNPAAGTTCTATESVPAGYAANQSGCVGVALNGSCTISNVLMTVPTNVPTLSQWALILLSTLLGIVGFVAYRKQAARA